MIDITSQQPIDRWSGEEAHVQTAIVATRKAGLAGVADDIRFDGDAVSDLQVFDRRMLGDDDAGGFVAQNVIVCDDHGTDAPGVPEMDV